MKKTNQIIFEYRPSRGNIADTFNKAIKSPKVKKIYRNDRLDFKRLKRGVGKTHEIK